MCSGKASKTHARTSSAMPRELNCAVRDSVFGHDVNALVSPLRNLAGNNRERPFGVRQFQSIWPVSIRAPWFVIADGAQADMGRVKGSVHVVLSEARSARLLRHPAASM